MSLRQDRVRLLVFIKRRADLSVEEFNRYWLNTHSEVFTSLEIVKKNILKYEQLHINEDIMKQNALSALFNDQSRSGPNWDGIALLEADSFEKFQEVLTSDEYVRTVVPDEEKLLDRTSMTTVLIDIGTFIDKESSA